MIKVNKRGKGFYIVTNSSSKEIGEIVTDATGDLLWRSTGYWNAEGLTEVTKVLEKLKEDTRVQGIDTLN